MADRFVRIIDHRAPKTGEVRLQDHAGYIVRWHNGEVEHLTTKTVKRQKYRGKQRYELRGLRSDDNVINLYFPGG